MVTINAKEKERLMKGVKKFQPVLTKARNADINESDTVTIITDMLCDIFGYDKYENVTSEYAIKKTYCDLAIKLDDDVKFLIECKAAGLDLKDDHIRQATNYSADSGIEWAVLTNGTIWKVYKILFTKPVEKVLVYEFDFSVINTKKQSDLENLYYLSKEAFAKNSKATLDDLYSQKQILNRYIIGQIMLSTSVLDSVRKTVKKLFPDVKVDNEELHSLITSEIFKREIVEGDSAEDANKRVAKAEKAYSKPKKVVKTEE